MYLPAVLSRRVRAAVTVALAGLALSTLTPSAGAGTSDPATVVAPPGHPASVSAAAQVRRAPVLAARIRVPARVRQLVTIASDGWDDRTAQLRAWSRGPSGRWVLRRGPMPVVTGYNAWRRAKVRVQGDGTTPAGKFPLPFAFGALPDPGTRMEYRRFDRNDWWPGDPRDPATYNVWQYHRAMPSRWRASYSERLWDYRSPQYQYGFVVGFNPARGVRYSPARRQRVASTPADTRRGGAIFLHVRGSGYTAGCVGIDRAQLRWLLRWARAGARPWVAMGPYRYLTRL